MLQSTGKDSTDPEVSSDVYQMFLTFVVEELCEVEVDTSKSWGQISKPWGQISAAGLNSKLRSNVK